jgi:membrane-associated protease RseP (regulator of RpoE activity)
MSDQLAEYFGLSKRTGALVVFVFADSPAAKAGLKAGDVILNAGGETVENPLDLRRVLAAKPEGSLEVRVLRDKQEKTLTVQLEKGTGSWLLEADHCDEAEVRVAMAPMAVHIPKIRIAPGAIATPAMEFAPMDLQMLKIKVAPAAIAIPKMELAPMHLQIPKIKMAPLAMPSVMIDLAPMKIDLPMMKIAPVNIVVVPRRIVL